VKVNQIKRKASFFQRLTLSQWSEAYSIPVNFRIRFRWAAAKNKKDREIKDHLPKLFCRLKKTCRTMLFGSMQNHAWPKDMCKKTRKQAPDRASEATSLLPIWDLET
jgi:hypothetical protein